MSRIETIIDATIGREGRYSNNPADSGGETMWGITAKVARANGYNGRMADMPRQTAVDIYRKEFFIRPRFDQLLLRSPAICEEVFDTHVNSPSYVAVTFLQRALNWFNQIGNLYADLKLDGDLGPTTLSALDAFLSHRKSEGEIVLLRALNAQQGVRYGELSERRQKDEAFVYGWFANRVKI